MKLTLIEHQENYLLLLDPAKRAELEQKPNEDLFRCAFVLDGKEGLDAVSNRADNGRRLAAVLDDWHVDGVPGRAPCLAGTHPLVHRRFVDVDQRLFLHDHICEQAGEVEDQLVRGQQRLIVRVVAGSVLDSVPAIETEERVDGNVHAPVLLDQSAPPLQSVRSPRLQRVLAQQVLPQGAVDLELPASVTVLWRQNLVVPFSEAM